MRIDGEWALCDDGVIRPVVRGEVEAADGSWLAAPFLVDLGADCTVLAHDVLRFLGFTTSLDQQDLGGIAGTTNASVLDTRVRLMRDDGATVTFRGRYAALTRPEAMELSVLGRDILGHFAVIADQPGGVVCLLRDRHCYRIEES
jgi:hypothetical protein